MEWILLDLGVESFVKLLMSLGEFMLFNCLNGECQFISCSFMTLYVIKPVFR